VRWFLALLVITVAGALILVSRQSSEPLLGGTQKLVVVATIFPLADWLREIGGPDVEVHCLVSGGSNPHHFEPAIRDAALVARARALFAAGLGLDEWAGRLAANSGRGEDLVYCETGSWIRPLQFHTTVVPMAAGESAEHGAKGVEVEILHGHEHGQSDPHYWLDPLRACDVVIRLADELGKLDPPHGNDYKRRATLYVGKLQALNGELAARARGIPPGSQVVTFHDAYSYLLGRLGIGLAAVIQASPGVEPSARDVSEALRILRQVGQRVVFQEPMDNGLAARTIARELGAGLEILDPLDSEASSVGKTYLERVRHDLNVLADAVAK